MSSMLVQRRGGEQKLRARKTRSSAGDSDRGIPQLASESETDDVVVQEAAPRLDTAAPPHGLDEHDSSVHGRGGNGRRADDNKKGGKTKGEKTKDGKSKGKQGEVKYKWKGWYGRWVAFSIFVGVVHLILLVVFMSVTMLVCVVFQAKDARLDHRIEHCWEQLKLGYSKAYGHVK